MKSDIEEEWKHLEKLNKSVSIYGTEEEFRKDFFILDEDKLFKKWYIPKDELELRRMKINKMINKNIRKINTFSNNSIKFGDYLLFQEYKYIYKTSFKDKHYVITKPILVIYLGSLFLTKQLGLIMYYGIMIITWLKMKMDI